MRELSAFQRDLMYAIAGMDEPYGLEVKRHLESYYGEEVNHAQLYPNMDKLVDAGLVRKGQKDRRTNLYELTEEGRAELRDRRQWTVDHVRAESDVRAEPVEN